MRPVFSQVCHRCMNTPPDDEESGNMTVNDFGLWDLPSLRVSFATAR
jgi:hypothetical protein